MGRKLTESCVAKISQTRIWNCFELGNVVGQIDGSFGCLGKNTWNILCQKKRKKRKKKKSTRKLLRKFYYKPGLIYGTMG